MSDERIAYLAALCDALLRAAQSNGVWQASFSVDGLQGTFTFAPTKADLMMVVGDTEAEDEAKPS